jgi:hypothetical protein
MRMDDSCIGTAGEMRSARRAEAKEGCGQPGFEVGYGKQQGQAARSKILGKLDDSFVILVSCIQVL